MRSLLTTVFGVALFTGVVAAQPDSQAPKPGPEQKRIGYFAGDWSEAADASGSTGWKGRVWIWRFVR